MRKYLMLILSIFLISFAFATCEEGQIDINTASITELDILYGIGESKAQSIIDARPYKNLDDLVNAYGIGPATLEKIKSQGLACVENEIINEEKSEEEFKENEEPQLDDEEKQEEKEQDEKINEEIIFSNTKEKEEIKKPVTNEIIHLNPKDIKAKSSSQVIRERDYSKYLIIIFCLILGFLFLVNHKNEKRKKEKTRRKNEWR